MKNLMRAGVLGSVVIVASVMASDVTDLKWMSGCWYVEGKEADSGEMWTRPLGNMLLGVGHISEGGEVRSYEYMRIEERPSDGMYFVAKPSGQAEVEFRRTEMGEHRVVFENPTHDFPQRISYWLAEEGVMKAKVEARENGGFKGFELTMLRSECRGGETEG